MSVGGRVRVLVVDDSAIARDLLERGLSADPGLEVIGKAKDAYEARDMIVRLEPDALTLDVEMPRMDGLEFLRRLLPQYPLPVVVVSALTAEGSRKAIEALEAGALGVVAKPSARDGAALKRMLAELAEQLKEAAQADREKLRPVAVPSGQAPARAEPLRPSQDRLSQLRPSQDRRSPAMPRAAPPPRTPVIRGPASKGATLSGSVILLGASTGGTVALTKVLTGLPADGPPVLVVQHMPPVFTRMFAESLDRQSRLNVKEAQDGDAVVDGMAFIAPGDRHMRLERVGAAVRVRLEEGPKVCGHRPSVDVLFESAAAALGPDAVAGLLTGMGRDGAAGLLALRRAGGRCLAQDEATSVVFGMPREAWELGAVESLVPIEAMARALLARVALRRTASAREPVGRP